MSGTGEVAYSGRSTYLSLNCRAVAQIQMEVLKRCKRSVISRLFHAKNDKETITTWRLDLHRVLHVFNVRSVTSV